MANGAKIEELKKAIDNINKKLAESHWSESSKNVLRKLKTRHEASIAVYESAKRNKS